MEDNHMFGSRHTQLTPSGSLHSGEHGRGLSNEISMNAQHSNSSIDFPVYAAVLQILLRGAGLFFPMPNSATSEEEIEKEEKLRYSEEMLQQGMTKFGLNSSNEKENFLTGNHESDITVKNNITIIEDEAGFTQ